MLKLVSRKLVQRPSQARPRPRVPKIWMQRLPGLTGIAANDDLVDKFTQHIEGPDAVRLWSDLRFSKTVFTKPRVTQALHLLAKQPADLLTKVFQKTDPKVLPFVRGTVLEKLAGSNVDTALQFVDSDLDIDAVLCGAQCRPSAVLKIDFPPTYRLPTKLVAQLNRHAAEAECVQAIEKLAPNMNTCMEYDRLLRRVYTNSDRGADAVEKICLNWWVPQTFYPFIVDKLSVKRDFDRLNLLFDKQLIRLAKRKPEVLMHLLVRRTIAVEGIAATAPILDQWESWDHVSRHTWLLLFTTFRQSGHPAKCLEILHKLLPVDAAVVSEYLTFVAQYYNVHVFLAAFLDVVPQAQPTLDALGILEYASTIPDPTELPLSPLPSLPPQPGLDFVHEAWLVATYKAMLPTVESVEVGVDLFERYLAYARQFRSSLKVTDYFVDLLAKLDLDAAELVFRKAVSGLRLAVANDGRNHAKSLETLCYHFARRGEYNRAFQLLIYVSEQPHAVIRGSALEPVLSALPDEMKPQFAEWAENVGARIRAR